MKQIVLNEQDIKTLLPHRKKDVHKGSVGKVLVIAGSRGMTGAAILTSKSVLLAGAGVVTLAAPNFLIDLIDVVNLEVMTLPLLQTDAGNISHKAFDDILRILPNFDTLVVGPGLSVSRSTQKFIKNLLSFISNEFSWLKVVVDADGLKCLKNLVRPLKMPTIITPHLGELAYILKRSIKEIKEKPYYYAIKLANKLNIVVVLKSDKTFIAEPNNSNFFMSNRGNPGMATAGSGDVLAGVITGLWASTNVSPVKASIVGVYLHSSAGNIAANKKSIDGIIASDILENIPEALKFFRGY